MKNNNNILLTSSLLSTAVIVLLSTSSLPLTTTTTFSQSPQQTNQLTDEEIQQQILKLQQMLAENHKPPIITPRDLLATRELALPNTGSLQYDALKNCNPNQKEPIINSTEFQNRWKTYITDFKCGHVVQRFTNNNTALRQFTLIAHDNFGFGNYVNITKNQTDPVVFAAWLFNNSLPGPTMRMTQGDHVRITVINSNESKWPHSFHMHSIHSGPADGVSGPGGAIAPGANFTYDFIARPFGVYPYHCHMEPVAFHIMRGLYGMMIIDPPTPRPPAKELVMLMNGYSFNQINYTMPNDNAMPGLFPPTADNLRSPDNREETLNPGGGEGSNDNQFYTVNGKAFAFTNNDMIHLVTNRAYRIYLVNMLEFDPVNSFHIHGNMFNVFPSGTSMISDYLSDIVTLGQGDRMMMEFKYLVPGDYMFHSHINRFASLGWMGFFHVTIK